MDELSEVRALFISQKLAVLATQSNGQPHGCLVAFAGSDDLRYLVFVTERDTRKYQDIRMNPRVAVLVDSRSNRESDFAETLAVTARGSAAEAEGKELDECRRLYLAKHPYLAEFVDRPGTALIRVRVEEYLAATFRRTWVVRPPQTDC
ncbi:MAG: pyridoxamine 5'-phosphate oxidase family protein [Chloroflexi bacterium]|nr:pyridoxamine 5'-phosphate oxidase family protein [Chloroflexota bacterium]